MMHSTENGNWHSADESSSAWREAGYQSAIIPAELPSGFQGDSVELPVKTMSAVTKASLGLLLVALLAGLSADILLRATPWGINLLVWMVVMIAATAVLVRRPSAEGVFSVAALEKNRWLLTPLIFFAGAFAWRDSAVLKMLDVMGLMTVLSLMAFRSRAGQIALAGISDYAKSLLTSIVSALGGAVPLLFGDVHWREIPRDGWSGKLSGMFRGLLIAAPLLCIFGTLLASADEIFSQMLMQTFSFDASGVVRHALMIVGVAWLVGGILRLLLGKADEFAVAGKSAQRISLGMMEIGTVLSLLNVLFLSFVIVQFRYLFGGGSDYLHQSGVTYSEYARSGFFELVTVTGLVLPLLLLAHWLLRKDQPLHEYIFRALAGGQIALLYVMMASAVQRMRMYQLALGLTELRFYTMAFMGWLAIVFLWFVATVLRGRRNRFAFGSVMTGFAMIAALNAINPDALIVRANFRRAVAGQSTDLHYTTSLSMDSIPTIIEWLPRLKTDEQVVIISELVERSSLHQDADWRTWNWSRRQARRASSALLQNYSDSLNYKNQRLKWRRDFNNLSRKIDEFRREQKLQ
jgi:hypothetical protein